MQLCKKPNRGTSRSRLFKKDPWSLSATPLLTTAPGPSLFPVLSVVFSGLVRDGEF